MTASRHVSPQGMYDPGAGDSASGHPGSAAGGGPASAPGADPLAGESPRDTELLTALLDGMDVALCAFDAEGVVTHWNREAEKLLGWTAEEAVGRRGLTGWAVRDADAEKVHEQLRDAMASGGHRRVHEFALVSKGGRRVLVRAQSAAVHDPDGEPDGAYWAFSEVHTQIEFERSLALSEALLEDAPWGVVLVDADLRPAVVNTVASRCLRTARDSLLGRPLAELLRDGAEELEAAVQHVLGEGAPKTPAELWISLREDDTGARYCWQSSFLRLASPLGEEPVPLGVAWLFRDVTAAKQAERETAQLRFRHNQLHRASRAAAECEDPMEAAQAHLDFALAGFADHALIDLVAGEGQLVRAAVTPSGAAGPCVPAETAGIPVRYGEGHPARRAAERSGSVRATIGRVPSAGERSGSWAAERRWPADTAHGLCTVLRSRGRTLGVLTFLRGSARRSFDRVDAAYAEDVAVRVAAALDLVQQC